MRLFVSIIFATLCVNSFAVELICKGDQGRMQNQRAYYVDCTNRKEVIDALGSAQTARPYPLFHVH